MSEFSHRYSVRRCPECQNDLTQPDGVTIETADQDNDNKYLSSRLTSNGTVIDVDCVIKNGFRSDTLCGKWSRPLNEYEVFGAAPGLKLPMAGTWATRRRRKSCSTPTGPLPQAPAA